MTYDRPNDEYVKIQVKGSNSYATIEQIFYSTKEAYTFYQWLNTEFPQYTIEYNVLSDLENLQQIIKE